MELKGKKSLKIVKFLFLQVTVSTAFNRLDKVFEKIFCKIIIKRELFFSEKKKSFELK